MRPVILLCRQARGMARRLHKQHPVAFNTLHATGHGLYFGIAFLEGTGLYSYASGALCIATIASLLVAE